ncbi:hypothetical protein AB3464_01335 [Pseudomonas asplenii]|uniref:hypothetical protein n=1 Tax=Pseudomonas asplenii TaxID=53407 RepID=UPI0037CB3106
MSMKSIFAPHERKKIYSGANSAIWHSHGLARSLAKSAVREEDYVATFVTDTIPYLVDRWAPLLLNKGITLNVSGVFCHGHPRVEFGSPCRRIELADLLVVHQHANAGRVTARAMLIQAKMSEDSTHSLSLSDAQLELFSNWPPFKFVTGGLPSDSRDIKERGKGSRYALVFDGQAYPEDIEWADQCPWAASVAKPDLTGDSSLAQVLGDMLLDIDGRPFNLGNTTDDWSRTIRDLLRITGLRTYKRTSMGRGHIPRLSDGSTPAGLMCFHGSGYATGVQGRKPKTLQERFFNNVPLIQDGGAGAGTFLMEEVEQKPGGISTLIIDTATGLG